LYCQVYWCWSGSTVQLLKLKTEVLEIFTGLPGCISMFSFSVDVMVTTATTITTAAVPAVALAVPVLLWTDVALNRYCISNTGTDGTFQLRILLQSQRPFRGRGYSVVTCQVSMHVIYASSDTVLWWQLHP